MASLFDDYAVIAESGLFDAEYYLATNPEVAELDCDLPIRCSIISASRKPSPPNPHQTILAPKRLVNRRCVLPSMPLSSAR